jgi:hypothetical protein
MELVEFKLYKALALVLIVFVLACFNRLPK